MNQVVFLHEFLLQHILLNRVQPCNKGCENSIPLDKRTAAQLVRKEFSRISRKAYPAGKNKILVL